MNTVRFADRDKQDFNKQDFQNKKIRSTKKVHLSTLLFNLCSMESYGGRDDDCGALRWPAKSIRFTRALGS